MFAKYYIRRILLSSLSFIYLFLLTIGIQYYIDCAVLCLVAQSCLTLCDPMDCSPQGSFVHGDSPGKNTEVDCHALLQGIFPTQRSNPGFSSCRWILYHLSHENIGVGDYPMDTFAILCSRGASPPRNRTEIFKTAGRFLTS